MPQDPYDQSNLAELAAALQSANSQQASSLMKAFQRRFGYSPVMVVPPPWGRGEWAQLLRGGHCFYGQADMAASAGEYGWMKLFNPQVGADPTTARRILVFSAGCWAAAAVDVELQFMDADVSTGSAYDAQHALVSDEGDSSRASTEIFSVATYINTQFFIRRFVLAAGGVWQDYERNDNGIIADLMPGKGIALRAKTANKAFSGRFSWAEVPVQGPIIDNGEQRFWP